MRAASQFPAVMVTGPRQSGKSTLLQKLFGAQYRYAALDLPDVRAAAHADPRGFLEHYAPPVILDEVQSAPGLLPYIRAAIDSRRSEPGQYLLTGSQSLALSSKITETLAGRTAVLQLLPMSRREILGQPARPFPWEKGGGSAVPTKGKAIWQEFLRGAYPELVANPAHDAQLWHGSYVQTYLERDVRALRQIGDLTQFQDFLQLLAARNAQLLNLSTVARDLGIALNTAKAWLSVLRATYQITLLRPNFANVGKRLVKTPKLYFSDVGTLCYLTGLKDPEHAARGPMGGSILDTAVLSELTRTLSHRGLSPRVYFWRTTAGSEVDFVVDVGGKLVPIEVKLSGTPRPAMARSIRVLRKDLGHRAWPGYLVHSGEVDLPLGPGVKALPFTSL